MIGREHPLVLSEFKKKQSLDKNDRLWQII